MIGIGKASFTKRPNSKAIQYAEQTTEDNIFSFSHLWGSLSLEFCHFIRTFKWHLCVIYDIERVMLFPLKEKITPIHMCLYWALRDIDIFKFKICIDSVWYETKYTTEMII